MDKNAPKKQLKEILKKPQVKSVLLGLLTLIIGGLCSSLGNWDSSQEFFFQKVISTILLLIVYVYMLIFYSAEEINERRVRGILERRMKTYEDFMSSLIAICRQNSIEVNSCIHNVKSDGKIDLNIWSFDKACRQVCSCAYSSLCNTIGNKNIGIAYIKLVEGENPEKRITMNAFANETMSAPRIYRKKRDFTVDNEGSYHDEYLFRDASTEIEILMTPEEIEDAFAFRNRESRKHNRGKYSQYVAIPVFCNDNKMVGLLEVVAFNGIQIGVTKEEVREIANKFLQPYAYMFLLLHKLEKSLLVGTR
nr:hypothetical protein [uncultured Agathobaculum sp.]